MYIFLKIAMLILQYKFQRMRNEHNCRSMQTSFPRLQQNRRTRDFDLDELDGLLEPFRSRSEYSSNRLNDSSARNSAERHPDGQGYDDYTSSPKKEQIGECVEKIFGCLNKLQDIIKSHRSSSFSQESRASQDPLETQVMYQPESQILNIKPNVQLSAASQIIDLRDDEAEEEAQSGMTFEQLFNPLSSMLNKPIERLEEDPSLHTQEIPSGQQQRPMKADESTYKEVDRVIALSDSINNSPQVEVPSIRAPRKKKKIRKSMRILSRNERMAIDLDDEDSVKSERVVYEVTESDQAINANETGQPEQEEPQVFGEADREPQREVVEFSPMEVQGQPELRQERPLPQEEESDSESYAIPAEQNHITQLSSRQVSQLIVPNGSQRRQTSRDQRITEQFESVIRIVSSRLLYNNKIYKWQLGPQRFWKTLSEALSSNFQTFIKESQKYKAKFLKYLPEDVKYKKENIFKVQQFHGEGVNREMKMERVDEERARRKRKELASLKKLFNKVQLAKVTDYERRLEERSDSSDGEESKFTEYEPEDGTVNEILADLVAKTNEKMRSKKTKSLIMSVSEENRVEEKAENEMVVYRLSEAIDNFNYVENMKRIYELNKKVLSLSCLEALRSNNLKVINKSTFEAEMKRLKLMQEAIILPDDARDNPSFEADPPLDLKVQSLRGKLRLSE